MNFKRPFWRWSLGAAAIFFVGLYVAGWHYFWGVLLAAILVVALCVVGLRLFQRRGGQSLKEYCLSYFWEPIRTPVLDCKTEFKKTAFLWRGLLVTILFLGLFLTIVEGIGGDTNEAFVVKQDFVARTAEVYHLDPNVDYSLRRSSKWCCVIYRNPCEIFRLLSESCYVTLISVTTIGFGDVAPTTFLGRMIAVADAVVGFLAFGLYVNTVMHGLRGFLSSK